MIALPNGCSCSEISVTPKNWKTIKANVKRQWRIIYRFYDPAFKGTKKWGKQIPVKGMNEYHDLADRQAITQGLIEDELDRLKNDGYNPITRLSIPPVHESGQDIEPNTRFADALTAALPRLKCIDRTRKEIKNSLVHINSSIVSLRFHRMPISEVRIRNIILLLEQVRKNNQGFGASSYNHYRSYLMMLFKVIVPMANMQGNPVRDIPKEREIKEIKQVLTDEERQMVNNHLFKEDPNYWRFMHIFFHSGARITELMRVKREDVDMKKERVKILILKGQQYVQRWKPIKTIVLNFWKEVYCEAAPGQFLFSRGFKPADIQMNPKQATDRWRLLVKKPLKITADFYSLKHLNTTETTDLLDEQAAADMNSHTSTAMVVNIYDVKREVRKSKKDELLKAVNNPFA